VIARAREILGGLERDELSRGGRPTLSSEGGGVSSPQLGLFGLALESAAARSDDPVRARLRDVDVNSTTPLEALSLLSELQQLARERKD